MNMFKTISNYGEVSEKSSQVQALKAITDRLSQPKLQLKPNFFGLPKIQSAQEGEN